ncbi:hypothetical protein HXS80_20570 [Streptomyces sp. CB04723]|uniref:hypothetical protein n=1 Tax=Streptomyces TaxID=1883 RepID=UPI0015C44DD2|nr:hypothetical protein [Streptomyces sp. CB04723]QLG33798.1 hypothetical protein HXS80_20570 [Streptomyces sp. CB04723]
MGQQIIRQPDGRLAVFDSVVDAFVFVDGTPDEIVEWRAEEAADRAREDTRAELDRVATRDEPYHQFTLTWEEAAERHRRNSA